MKSQKPKPQPLQPGDYYMNAQGLMVFTEQYHLRRGSCCSSGCTHCPWRSTPSQRKKSFKEEEK